MKTHYYKELARFDFASNKKDWQVVLRTEHGLASETWPEDDEPDIDGLLPSEVLDLIEARCQSWWISTSRENQLKTIAKIREHKNEVDLDWLDSQASRLEKKAAQYRSQISDILSDMEHEAA